MPPNTKNGPAATVTDSISLGNRKKATEWNKGERIVAVLSVAGFHSLFIRPCGATIEKIYDRDDETEKRRKTL